MGNYNIQVDLTKLPGAKVMEIQGKTTTKQCVVLPIDNVDGVICDGYMSKGPDGCPTMKFYSEVKLNLVAIEHRAKRNGISHGLKPSFSKEKEQRMTEEQLFAIPWCGILKPWARKDDDDLPEGNVESKAYDW